MTLTQLKPDLVYLIYLIDILLRQASVKKNLLFLYKLKVKHGSFKKKKSLYVIWLLILCFIKYIKLTSYNSGFLIFLLKTKLNRKLNEIFYNKPVYKEEKYFEYLKNQQTAKKVLKLQMTKANWLN